MSSDPDVVTLAPQFLGKLCELATVYQHVWDISRKIAEMEDDPLPEQLEQSVPCYLHSLETYTEALGRRRWPVMLAGDNELSIQSFLYSYVDESSLLDSLPSALLFHQHVYIGFHSRQYAKVIPMEADAEPFIVQNSEGLAYHLTSMQEAEKGIQHVEIYLPIEALKGGLQFFIPSRGDYEVSALRDVHAVIYVMESAVSQKMEAFLRRVLNEASIAQRLLTFAPFLVIQDKKIPNAGEILLERLRPYLPCIRPSSIIDAFHQYNLHKPHQKTHHRHQQQETHQTSPQKSTTSPEKIPNSVLSESDQESVMNLELASQLHVTVSNGDSMDGDKAKRKLICAELVNFIEMSVTFKCQGLYSWLYSFVGRVMHHLRSFLSQAEKSQDERRATYTAITQQLQQLTSQTHAFFSSLRKEVDGKVTEALALLQAYLMRDDVISCIANWSENEAPNDDIWSDVDAEIRQKITDRIQKELLQWEKANKFFTNLRPCLIVHFEQRFVPIEQELNEVETRIARHDSQVRLREDASDLTALDRDQDRLWCLPGSMSLNWQQKVLIGVAAPVLFPLAITIALLGLPIIGGLMAKDLIVEKIAENKLREYNTDKVKYLRRRTVDEVTKFCHSKNLELFVQAELRPAYQCLEQLQNIIPTQIEANKAQIESLKNDVRDAKDVSRFYLPLVEVFEHYRLLLMLYKVLHMKREKVDIDAKHLEIAEGVPWTSVGLQGSIKTGYLINPGQIRKTVSVKFFKVKLDIHNVEDYLQEESAYRFQASTYIAKFVGICKLPRGEFTHILEPLKCSLRDYAREHAILGQKGTATEAKYQQMKHVITEVVRGLDYLHERGWVHFDLNMDSVCVDYNNRVKLINISSRRIFRLPSTLSHADIYKYTHLPAEVLMSPPSSYTQQAEMYCVGVMMWELWTAERAYYHEIGDPQRPLDTMVKFVAHVERCRPSLDTFYKEVEAEEEEEEEKSGGVRRGRERGETRERKKIPVSKMAEVWLGRLAQCWSETERISSKAWLQLMDEVRLQNTMEFTEQHFEN